MLPITARTAPGSAESVVDATELRGHGEEKTLIMKRLIPHMILEMLTNATRGEPRRRSLQAGRRRTPAQKPLIAMMTRL